MNKQRFLSFVLALTMISAVSAVSASADIAEQDCLSVTYSTDKAQYGKSDTIKATLKVTNNNEGSVYDVGLEGSVPDGYTVADGSKKDRSIAELKSGETVELETSYVPKATNTDSGKGSSNLSGNGGGSSSPTAGGTLGSRAGRPSAAPAGSGQNNTASTEQGTSSEPGTAPSSPEPVPSPSGSEGENTDNPKSGAAESSVPYILAVLAAGAMIMSMKRGKGKQMFSLIIAAAMMTTLLPGVELKVDAAGTLIKVTADTVVDGKKLTLSARVTYSLTGSQEKEDDDDFGEISHKEIEAEHVQPIENTEDNAIFYVDNQLVVSAKKGVEKSEIEELAESVGGKIVGYLEIVNYAQIEFESSKTKAELEAIAEELKASEKVNDAYLNWVTSETTDSAPQIPPYESHREEYDKNWGIKAINADKAWEYMNEHIDSIIPINVGLLDGCFDTNHNDLSFAWVSDNNASCVYNMKMSNENYNHGTHVAGIMAANGMNDEGISGVFPFSTNSTPRLFAVSSDRISGDAFGISFVDFVGQATDIATLVSKNVRVINYSMSFYVNEQGEREKYYDYWSNHASIADKFATLLDGLLEEKPFVIVAAAGNASNEMSILDCESASLYTLIDKTHRCYNNIIVVGAVNKNYYKCNYSNCGNRIDIFAPGGYKRSGMEHDEENQIYSTILDDSNGGYGYLNGTSMATPFVSGVAADVWSMNYSLSGEDVKRIVCNSMVDDKIAYIKPNGIPVGVIDCDKAVKCAFEQKQNNNIYGSATGHVFVVGENEAFFDGLKILNTHKDIQPLFYRSKYLTLSDDKIICFVDVGLSEMDYNNPFIGTEKLSSNKNDFIISLPQGEGYTIALSEEYIQEGYEIVEAPEPFSIRPGQVTQGINIVVRKKNAETAAPELEDNQCRICFNAVDKETGEKLTNVKVDVFDDIDTHVCKEYPGDEYNVDMVLPANRVYTLTIKADGYKNEVRIVSPVRQETVVINDVEMTKKNNTLPADFYDTVIDRIRKGLETGWSEYSEGDRANYLERFGSDPTKVGYLIKDLDGDGRDELIIGNMPSSGYWNYEKNKIIELYAYKDGIPSRIIWSHSNRNVFYLTCSNKILNLQRGTESLVSYSLCSFSAEFTQNRCEYITSKSGSYYYTSYEGNQEEITREEFDNRKKEWTQYAEFDLTPFGNNKQEESEEVTFDYFKNTRWVSNEGTEITFYGSTYVISRDSGDLVKFSVSYFYDYIALNYLHGRYDQGMVHGISYSLTAVDFSCTLIYDPIEDVLNGDIHLQNGIPLCSSEVFHKV